MTKNNYLHIELTWKQLSLFGLLLGFSLILGEIIWAWRVQPTSYLKLTYMWEMGQGQKQKINNQRQARIYLNQATQTMLKIVAKSYPNIRWLKSLKDLDTDGQLRQFLEQQPIGEIGPGGLPWGRLRREELALYYYNLGLKAYQLQRPELTVKLWRISKFLAPEWSYFAIELANYYRLARADDNSRQELLWCQQFYLAKDYCSYMEKSQFDSGQAGGVGFLADRINRGVVNFLYGQGK